MVYDLVIRNGTVIDGSGRPGYRADVAVAGGRIVAIGRIRDPGTEIVDAEGHFVTPGFIDGHTHLDAQVFWEPLGTCACWHGVTSAVMGNCGFTIAPCRPTEKDLVLRSIERAEDIQREDVLTGVDWRWETFPQYLDALDATPKGINYAAYVGHSALRAYVMGERAFEGEATEQELAAMGRELDASLRAGAVGFSTTCAPSHRTRAGRPVASRLASWSELETLVSVLGQLGRGVFQLAYDNPPDEQLRQAHYDKLEALAVRTGRPITLPLLHPTNHPELPDRIQALMAATATSGGRMVGQVHSRELLSIVGFPAYLPFDRLPRWRDIRGRPLEEQQAALMNPEVRAELVDAARRGEYADGFGTEVRPPRYETMRVLDRPEAPYRTVAQVAAERGCTAVDAVIDLSLESGMQRLFAQPFANEDLTRVLELLRHPQAVVAASDTGAHVSQISDSSIPTFLLSHWVRGKEAFTWEEAIQMLTSRPASLWGFSDRGLIEEGRAADLVVFDPQRIAPDVPTVDRDLPAGGKRLTQKARGLLATVVNGEVLVRDGQHTGAFPGRVLRPTPTSRSSVA
jgi:N-acyl-D-amino-acid deacylase